MTMDTNTNTNVRDAIESQATALSYGFIGNESLYLYFIIERSYIARIPLAMFDKGDTGKDAAHTYMYMDIYT